MNGDCGCHVAYKCSTCGNCYYHDHSKFLSGETGTVQWFWRCPSGAVKPCHPDPGDEPAIKPAKGMPIPRSKSQAKRFEIQSRGKKR